MRPLWLVLILVVALVPVAQAGPSDVTLTPGELKGTIVQDKENRVPYTGTAKVPFTLTVGCGVLVQAAAAGSGTAKATVKVVDPPAWMTVTPATGNLAPSGCGNPDATVTFTGDVSFTLGAEAPGVVAQTLNLSATVGSVTTPVKPILFAVEYHPAYDVVPDVTFPYTMHGPQATFNITVTQRSNARSMVMFEEVAATTGQVSGMASVPYDNLPSSKKFVIHFKAPTTTWTEARVSAKTYSHYLLAPPSNAAGQYALERDLDWTFVNAAPQDTSTTKASPLAGWPLLVSILGAALVARRRA